jgi:hypothetical protein
MMDQSLRGIAERTCGPWLEYREGEARADRATGRKASGDVALLARRHADMQDGLLGRARSAVLALRRDLADHAQNLHRQVGDLARERDEHIGQKLIECREQRQAVLGDLERTIGPRAAAYAAATRTLEETEKAHRTVRAEVHGRPLRRGLVQVYLPLLTFLALIEVPVNRLAFELFFQEQPAFSLALALAAGIVLMFFAHLVGLLARRMEQPAPWPQQLKKAAGIVLFLGLAFGLMYVLASMRQLFVQLLNAEQGSLAQQVEQLTRGGAAGTVARVTQTELGTAGWTLLMINVALFAFGAAASFLRHDPHPDYEAAWRGQERARKRLSRLRARYEKAVATRQREFDTRLTALDELLRETQGRHDQLAAEEAAVGPFFEETVARVANTVRNRSLAWLEGALAGIPPGTATAAVIAVQAMPEREVLRAIAPDGDTAA